jgi:uncharacterized protein involved in propanediol utilization
MFNKYKEKYERLLAEHNRLWGMFQTKINENNIARAHLGRIAEMNNVRNMKMLAKQALKEMGKYYKAV